MPLKFLDLRLGSHLSWPHVCTMPAHPTFLTFTLQCHPGRQHPKVPFPRWAGDGLCHKRAVWPWTSHLTLWGLGFLISTARGLAIDYLEFPDSRAGGSTSHPSSIPRDRHFTQRTLEKKVDNTFSIYQMFAECLCLILCPCPPPPPPQRLTI